MRRVLINSALVYLVAAVTLALAVFATDSLAVPGPSAGEVWVYEMSLLLVGLPLVLIALWAIDVLLTRLRRRRLAALGVALFPALALSLFISDHPTIVATVEWLLVTGFVSGLLVRLPGV